MSHRITKEELDAQFDLFLRESLSDDSVDKGSSLGPTRARGGPKSPPKSTLPWWKDDDNISERTGREVTPSRFLKSRRPQTETDGDGQPLEEILGTSHSFQEGDEDLRGFTLKEDNARAAVLSPDAKQNETGGSDSEKIPGVNMMPVGMDTLEEEDEKAGFFAHLEAGASSSLDYCKLNRELDVTLSTGESLLRKAEEATEERNEGFIKPKLTQTPPPDSPAYSEDFENEEKGKEAQDEENKKEEDEHKEKPALSAIMAEVSLFDTLDDTGGDNRRNETGASLDKGNMHMKSGGSDAEALQEAYRQIHVVDTSDDFDHYRGTSSAADRGRMFNSRSPAPPEHQDKQTLQPSSTNESDLPTAEELMRPIRIDENQIRGFTLQPVSFGEQPIQGKPFSDGTYTKSVLRLAGIEENAARLTNIKDLTHHPFDQQDLSNDPVFSIREEVEKLMEDDKKTLSYKSSLTQKSKKQTNSHVATVSRPASSSGRKPVVIPSRGKVLEKKSTTSSRWSGMNRGAATTRTSSVQQPLKPKPTKNQEKENHGEPTSNVSSELVSSVQSLVTVLQQQMGDSSPQKNTVPHYDPPEIIREDEGPLVTHLRLQLSEKEQELQLMTAAAEEVHSLRQQMYLLQSKLRSAEEVGQKNRWAEATDSTTEAALKQMEKELKEQETLINGYQQENEKLYLEVKDQKAKTKANQEAMFRENQRLLSELNYLKEQQSNINRLVGNTQLKDHTQRMADLLAQIQTLQRNEALLSEELHRLKQEKQALDVDLQLMKKERDLAIAQVISSTGDRNYAAGVLEETQIEEMSALRKKLQWFTDNQELQDRDAARLKAAAAEMQELKEQVEKLKLEVNKNSSQQQRKAKEKSSDFRKMQQLQQQVKELEHILRSKNPNSLPALIYAAAKAENDEDAASQTKKVTDLLERRIESLEAELESHDEEAKRNLRAMEQQFHNVKVRYEQQILKMEQRLLQKQQAEVPIPMAEERMLVKSLEAELQQVRESHAEKEKILQEQIKSLQQQIKTRAQSPKRHQRQAEEAFGVRIERMSQEIATKTRTIQELSRTVERLQKERRFMLSAPIPRKEDRSTEIKHQHPTPSKTRTTVSSTQTYREEETFPDAHDEKSYQPTVYAGSHISEVLQENTALTQRMKMLEEEQEQEKEALHADAAKAREELRRHQEWAAEQLSTLKAQHLRELDQLRATYALEHSSSKVAEQANRIDTQEIQLKHLQEQLKELQETKDALALSMAREGVLEKQLMRLLKELQEAKDAQSSEVKLLCSLEKKVVNLELRHQHRETLMNQRSSGSWEIQESNSQSAEVERWKSVAQEKCKEIETFRLELDSILDIIKHLQKQGVVFPTPGQAH